MVIARRSAGELTRCTVEGVAAGVAHELLDQARVDRILNSAGRQCLRTGCAAHGLGACLPWWSAVGR